jgi:serine/threonine protein kinase
MPAQSQPAPAPSRRLEPGVRVGGKYRLLSRIAVGGMGEVWRARNETTEAEVAVKVSRRGMAEAVDERFRTEAKLGSSLSHRNIVRIFDLVEDDDGSFVLVMELLRGESLAQYIKTRGKLSTKEAVAIAVPILAGLGQAHDGGIVHRDVTPANILLAVDPDGHVTPKLIDFGIAKLPAAGKHTLDGRVLGTPRYMAPEQIRGQAIDGRTDLFSLAIVLYEAISGVCPFDATSPSASLAAVLESAVDADPSIEPRVWLELERALGKRPYERHASAVEMAEALRSATDESNASLASILDGMRPSRGALALEEHSPTGRSTVEGQSVEGFVLVNRTPRLVWVAAAVVVAAVVGLGTSALLRAPAKGAASAPAAPIATTTSVSPIEPAIVAAPESPSGATPTVEVPPPAASQPPLPRPVRAPRPPRRVGTQPGF